MYFDIRRASYTARERASLHDQALDSTTKNPMATPSSARGNKPRYSPVDLVHSCWCEILKDPCSELDITVHRRYRRVTDRSFSRNSRWIPDQTVREFIFVTVAHPVFVRIHLRCRATSNGSRRRRAYSSSSSFEAPTMISARLDFLSLSLSLSLSLPFFLSFFLSLSVSLSLSLSLSLCLHLPVQLNASDSFVIVL